MPPLVSGVAQCVNTIVLIPQPSAWSHTHYVSTAQALTTHPLRSCMAAYVCSCPVTPSQGMVDGQQQPEQQPYNVSQGCCAALTAATARTASWAVMQPSKQCKAPKVYLVYTNRNSDGRGQHMYAPRCAAASTVALLVGSLKLKRQVKFAHRLPGMGSQAANSACCCWRKHINMPCNCANVRDALAARVCTQHPPVNTQVVSDGHGPTALIHKIVPRKSSPCLCSHCQPSLGNDCKHLALRALVFRVKEQPRNP